MAPVTKFEDHPPAVSLLLVKPASNDDTSSNIVNLTPASDSSDGTSRAALMQMIYEMLLLIGDNMSKVQQANAETQLDQGKLAQVQSDAAKTSLDNLNAQLEKLQKEQEKAAKWALFGKIMKWVGVGLALLVGALLCETPIGFMILAATIAFTASPLFNMTVNALSKGLVDLGMPPEWAKIVAEAIVIVAVVIVSFGAEALTVGMQGGIAAVETGTEVVAQGGTTISKEVIEETAEDLSQEVTDNATEQGTGQSNSKTQTYRTVATTNALLQTLMSSSLIPDLLNEAPGIKKHPWLVALLTVLIEIAAALAAFKATPLSGESMMNRLAALAKTSNGVWQVSAATVTAIAAIVSSIATMGQGYNELEQSETNKKIAPIQSMILLEEGLVQILNQISNNSMQAIKQSLSMNKTINEINFSDDMKAVVAAQHQYQG